MNERLQTSEAEKQDVQVTRRLVARLDDCHVMAILVSSKHIIEYKCFPRIKTRFHERWDLCGPVVLRRFAITLSVILCTACPTHCMPAYFHPVPQGHSAGRSYLLPISAS
jgi:hypothetical protein